MRIAILGWGSLLWEGGLEFDSWHDAWEYDGPILKLEFSRISEKRLKALTLVIDTENGAETAVAWCLSKRMTLADAMQSGIQPAGVNYGVVTLHLSRFIPELGPNAPAPVAG